MKHKNVKKIMLSPFSVSQYKELSIGLYWRFGTDAQVLGPFTLSLR